MRAVARLVWTCFTATPLMRWCTGLGSCLALLGIAGYIAMPAWTLGNGIRREDIWLQSLVLMLPMLGLLLLLAATALLPAIVERLALGRAIWLLPFGRSRLLAATLVPSLLLALLTATTATIAFLNYPLEISYTRIFWRTFLMAFVDFGLIYTAIWLVGKTSGVWRLAGMIWILLSLTIPLRYVGGIPPFSPLEGIGLALWAAFALVLLAGGRLRHTLAGWRAGFTAFSRGLPRLVPYRQGNEIDLLLGTTRPWLVAFGQALPIAFMLWLIPDGSVWLVVWFVFLMLFSAIAGAITSHAAERSRRLWLRFDWTRDQMRRRVELAFWRYNAYSLGALVLIFLGIGVSQELDPAVVATGVALLILGGVACTYLGLTITRGLGWLESILCIVTLVALTLAALAIARGKLAFAIELEVLLAVLAMLFRLLALARWKRLDWMLCRPA